MAIEQAIARGASDAEAYLACESGLSARVFGGKVEKFVFSEARGIGLRVYLGSREGRAYTSDLSCEAIAGAVASAADSAKVMPLDPARALPEPSLYPDGASAGAYMGEDLDIFARDLERVTASEKIDFAMKMERLARERDRRVTSVEAAVYNEDSGVVTMANTRGFRAAYRASICYGYVVAIAEEKDESQTGFGFTAGRSFASLDPGAAGVEGADMAVAMLGGRQIETARVPVLLDNLATAEILSALGAALSGESVMRGRSFLAGRIGEAIASSRVTVIDDGTIKEGFGTAPFDGEGVTVSRKPLIEVGALETFLHNSYTSARMGVATGGNAGRGSFRSSVGVAPTNIFLEPGDTSPDELRSEMGTGFEVKELQGAHVGLNPVTGEVSVGGRGRWIENGRPIHAVREVTIAGTIDGILKGVVGVGNDLRFTPLFGGASSPSILVEGLTVSGQ